MNFFGHDFYAHVDYIISKASKRIYVLKNLRKNGIKTEVLVRVYKSQIRSVLEFGAPAFYPLLTQAQLDKIERVQNICLKTILGYHFSSEKARDTLIIPSIQNRFMDLTDRFILKEYDCNVMAWLQERPNAYLTKLRHPRLVQETQCKSARVFKGPINYYKRRINVLLNLRNNSGNPN